MQVMDPVGVVILIAGVIALVLSTTDALAGDEPAVLVAVSPLHEACVAGCVAARV